MASISGVDIALVDCRVIVLLDDKEDVHIIAGVASSGPVGLNV